MRQYRDWKKLLALMLALVLAMATPLQASEINQEDAEEDVVIVEDAGSTVTPILAQSPEESQEDATTPVEDAPEVVVNEISEVTENEISSEAKKDAEEKQPELQTSEENSEDTVWLHVVNGNFSGSYDGVEDVSKEASIKVTLGEGRTLPESVRGVSAIRTNGTFDGWYTQAPTEALVSQGDYSVWHTESKNGEQIEVGKAVPEDVNVLYAAFDDAKELTESDKLVEFYLDWNGFNGQTARLTCIRSYNEGGVKFTAKDAAVYGLNFKDTYEKEFSSSEDQWTYLNDVWSQETFDGYKFLGWSTMPKGGDLVKGDTKIEDGMTFYAHWEIAGDPNNSSETFEKPEDPAAGLLEGIHIEAGAGTKFVSGTLEANKHAAQGESFMLNLFYAPVRATINDITWNIKSVTVENSASIQDIINPRENAVDVDTVKAGGEANKIGGIEVKAEGSTLTITNTDGKQHGITVSATAKGADGTEFSSPANATLSFTHSWDKGEQKGTLTCTEGATIHYTCTVEGCGAIKDPAVSALGHVYEKNVENPKDSEGKEIEKYYKVLKDPTCTEPGERQLLCVRDGCTNKSDNGNSPKGVIPALGHVWSAEVRTPASCNKDTVTRQCTRCNVEEASLVPAYHPELHEWTETERHHNSCMSDIVYEKCGVCGETRSRTEDASNPECHQYVYASSMRNDCYHVTYTFKCVFGCGATQVMYKNEEGHAWGGWTVTTTLDKTTGMMKRVQERECSRCDKKETKDLGSVAVGVAEGSAASVGNNTVATQPMSYSAGNAVAAAVAQAAPSAATVSEGKAGWKKSGKKKYYLNENGKKKTGWQKIDGKKYYFGKDGVMKTGWQTIKGKKYYFGKDGVMRTGKQKIGKKTYNFGKNGVLK